MINQGSSREPIICILCSIENHLGKIKRKVIQAGYQDNTMIISGVENILKICEYNHHSSPENHIYFTIRLILYILPRRNSFYGLITSVANKFIEHRSLECALVDMLVLLSKYRDELRLQHSRVLIDNNFKRIFIEPKAIYQDEFNRYIFMILMTLIMKLK